MTDTTAIANRPRSVLLDMADRFNMEPAAFEATVRNTVVPAGATREQFAAFLIVARDYRLNPLTREIYAFPAKGGGIVPIVGIDGWLSLANRHEQFDGIEIEEELDDKGELAAVSATVHRKDRKVPTKITEYLSECRRTTEPWKQWPTRMLRHKATIQAIRYAFSISGIYEPDEAERGDMLDVTPPRPTREEFSDKAKPAAPSADASKTAASNGGDHVTQERAGADATTAPADLELTPEQREAAEREADRMVAAAARGDATTDEIEEDDPVDLGEVKPAEIAGTPIPLKKAGGPDWIKWHTLVAARLQDLPSEHRKAFLAAHEAALGNYAEFSPQNAATLRNLIANTQ